MSEDLRYYFFDHDAEEHPPIPADEGWKQMQQLLDKELPLSSKGRHGRQLFFAAAILFGIAFLITSLPLQTYFEQRKVSTSVKDKPDAKETYLSLITEQNGHNEAFLQKATAAIDQKNFQENNTGIGQHLLPSLNEYNNVVSQLTPSLHNEYTVMENNSGSKSLPNAGSITAHETFANTTIPDTGDNVNENEMVKKKKGVKNNYKDWQFNAGTAVNVSFSNTLQSLRPYPFAELKYQFSPRFFASASVALFSPAGTKASGIKKTVYVNDTSYNVSNYNETLNYTRLTYADAGLTGGIKINKQISIHSGIQFSRLLNTKTNTSLVPYDFDMNRVNMTGQDVSMLPPTPSAAPVYNNRIDVQKFDIRYVAGINYDLKKISLSLQYQGGIKPVVKGDAVTADKNKMITLKAAYRFK